MTVLAYSQGKLCADTRMLIPHDVPGAKELTKDEVEAIKEFFEGDVWELHEKVHEIRDGGQKIMIPKRCYYRGSRVRAVGVSGLLNALKQFSKIKAGTELFTDDSFLLQERSWYLILTDARVHTIRTFDWSKQDIMRTTVTDYPLDSMVTIGGGELRSINGHKSEGGFTAEELINMSALLHSGSGGHIDTYDVETNLITRGPIDLTRVDTLARMYKFAATHIRHA